GREIHRAQSSPIDLSEGTGKSRGSRTAAPSDTLPTQAASLSMASANRATGVHSPDTRGRRVLIDRPEGRHARVACAPNTTSGERGALGGAGADQVRTPPILTL